jgi:WD40 repeat protein
MSLPPPLPAGSAARLDAQHPWPGLGSYDEHGSEFFSGRHAEALDLAQMIRLWGAVVLSGESGLGKTSLLRAGVFPRLWELNFFPVYIRLLHAPDAPPYGQQVIDRLLEECRNRPDMDPPVLPTSGESLWQWLHREDVEFWNSRNQLMTPVLVFDQFEEIFTRGAESRRRSETDAFFTELADIAENRRPDDLPRGCTEAQNYRVVLSLRKEYLSELEVCLGPRMPSALQNRFHLAPLSLDAALEVVKRPAEPGNLLESGAEMAIVAAVSGLRINRQIGGTLSAPEIEGNSRIEPALLCLLCSELNSERLRLGQERITTSLVEARGGDIIEGFYERALADFPVEVQRMVESLVTPNGQRLSRAEEEILVMPGITAEVIRELTENDRKRLLRRDRGLGGIPTLELVHDCLAPIVARHREERHRQDLGRERRIKQLKTIATIMGVLAVGALGTGLTIAWTQANAARKARDLSQQRLRQSAVTDDMIAAEKATRRDPDSSAYLARALENDPGFERARERAFTTLLHNQPAPDWLWTSPGMRFGPWADGDSIVFIDASGNLVTRSITAPDGKTRKLDDSTIAVVASDDADRLVTLTRVEVAQPTSNPAATPSSPRDNAAGSKTESAERPKQQDEQSPSSNSDSEKTDKSTDTIPESDTVRFRLRIVDRRKDIVIQGPLLDSEPRALCPSATDTRVMFLTDAGTLRIWDGKPDGIIRDAFEDEEIQARVIRASFTGGWHAIGERNGNPMLITINEDGTSHSTTLGHSKPIEDFIVTSGGSRLLARDINGKVLVFNTSGYLQRTIQANRPVRLMATDPLGLTYITVNDANIAEFWSVIDGEPCRPARPVSQSAKPVGIIDQGRHLVIAESDGSVYRYHSAWNPGRAESREITRLGAESNELFLLPASPLGKILAVASDDHRVHFIDPETGDARRDPAVLSGEPIPLIPLPGDDKLLAGGGSSVWLVPVSPDEKPREFKIQPESDLDPRVVDMVTSPDNRAFHVLTDTGALESHRLDDSQSAAEVRLFPDEVGKRLVLAPAGAQPWLAMTSRLPSMKEWRLRVFRMDADKPGESFVEWTTFSELWTIVTDPGGRWLAAVTLDSTITVFDLESDDPAGKGRRTLSLDSSSYHAAFLSGGDRPMLVTGDSQGQLSRWDVIDATARRDEFVNPCPDTVTSLTLSSSGRWLACTTFAGRAMIWDTASGFASTLPITHSARIWSFAFDESSDPVRVFTCSRDGRIQVTPLCPAVPHGEQDARNFARLLQWQSGQVIGEEGRAMKLSPEERRARLADAASRQPSALHEWTSAPPWEKGSQPGKQPGSDAPSCASLAADRRFSNPARHAYDRDPHDPLAILAMAAWIENPTHATWLADQVIPRLPADPPSRTQAVEHLCDAGLTDQAAKLVKAWKRNGASIDTALAAARACSLAGDHDTARTWLKPHCDPVPAHPGTLARLIIECFRAKDDLGGLQLFAKLEDLTPDGPTSAIEAWATLTAGIAGHALNPDTFMAHVTAAAGYFERNSGTYGWKRECHLGWAIASQFLVDHDKETEFTPLAVYRYALGEADLPFASSNFEKIHHLADIVDALSQADATPELGSAELYLGRVLHLWFSGDVEGARNAWQMLLDFDPQFEKPEFRATLQLWPYELEAIEKIVGGKDNWMEEVEIPNPAAEWAAFGLPDPDVIVELKDDGSEAVLAGRILHLSITGDQLNAVATANLLLKKNPSWAEVAYLESEGWEPEEIAVFLSVVDQATSNSSE